MSSTLRYYKHQIKKPFEKIMLGLLDIIYGILLLCIDLITFPLSILFNIFIAGFMKSLDKNLEDLK